MNRGIEPVQLAQKVFKDAYRVLQDAQAKNRLLKPHTLSFLEDMIEDTAEFYPKMRFEMPAAQYRQLGERIGEARELLAQQRDRDPKPLQDRMVTYTGS